MILRIKAYILISILYLFSLPSSAMGMQYPSSPEEIAFSFAKLTNTIPDIKMIIKGTKRYQEAMAIEKSRIIEEMEDDIKIKYLKFDKSENYLVIHSNIVVESVLSPNKDNGLKLNFSDSEIPYFPYIFGDNIISVIPDNLEQFKFVYIPRYDLFSIAKDIDVSGNNLMELILKPYFADNKKTIKMDGFDHYIIKAKIAQISIYGKDNKLLWRQTADWYNEDIIFPDDIFIPEQVIK